MHALNYGTIDLILITILILGSIIGVQVGQKLGEKIDSTEFKTILAILILAVGIAIAFERFIKEKVIIEKVMNGVDQLGPLGDFILQYSKDLPTFYGLTSVVLAIILGVGAAGVRKLASDWNKKRIAKLKASD